MPATPDAYAAPFFPIIYVRGFAMTRGERDDTTADPFCGFNLGSTVYRARPGAEKKTQKFVFESPLLRLGSDFGYRDVYENGLDILDDDWPDGQFIRPRSVIVHRYYDEASSLLGTGKTPPLTHFATELGELILRVRDLVCADPRNAVSAQDFRCYLVAHSMGGLVCRAFLQNAALSTPEARGCVAKFFTYATPHNGIDVGGMNVPSWLGLFDINNFDRDRKMPEYLDLQPLLNRFPELAGRADWIPTDALPPERIFCMIGSNRSDYEAAMGMSRTFAGQGSDGLVRIENAALCGVDPASGVQIPCAKAFAYRGHSGYFGIVNSEESYQNLSRFLFGDLRVDAYFCIDEVSLPAEVAAEEKKGRKIDALYLFEFLAAPRAKRWYLTRRMIEEDSAACRQHQQIRDPDHAEARRIFLSSLFLHSRWRIDQDRDSLAYGIKLVVKVPDYEIDRRVWLDRHYEGSALFDDSLIVEIFPPTDRNGKVWGVKYGWESTKVGFANRTPEMIPSGKGVQVEIPVAGGAKPGIKGRLVFEVSPWNQGAATSLL